jgi:PTS system galactitol-specific IIA component
MEYTFLDLLIDEHIRIDLNVTSAEEVIQILSDVLENKGFVEHEFANDVLGREKEFPTGLPTEPIGVAIPHADPDHILKTAVAIGMLKNAVQFSQMGMEAEKRVQVHVVFLLAIKEKEKQVTMIQQLVQLIQTPELLGKLHACESSEEALRVMTRGLE